MTRRGVRRSRAARRPARLAADEAVRAIGRHMPAVVGTAHGLGAQGATWASLAAGDGRILGEVAAEPPNLVLECNALRGGSRHARTEHVRGDTLGMTIGGVERSEFTS